MGFHKAFKNKKSNSLFESLQGPASKYYIFEPIEIHCCRTENRHDIAK